MSILSPTYSITVDRNDDASPNLYSVLIGVFKGGFSPSSSSVKISESLNRMDVTAKGYVSISHKYIDPLALRPEILDRVMVKNRHNEVEGVYTLLQMIDQRRSMVYVLGEYNGPKNIS